ncbi:hypothetical protein GGR56DRAFT_456279 [Xylariaceae sp. FL0804]|nr:hypothetical protein GGR56DRAFT_456279 [Xylariaceae sp. FL0804]
MSLRVSDGRRGRSRSPAGGDRSHSRQRVSDSPSAVAAVRMPSPPAGFSYDDHRDGARHNGSGHRMASPTDEASYYGRNRERSEERTSRGDVDMVEAAQDVLRRGADAFLPAKYAAKVGQPGADRDFRRSFKKERKKEKLEDDLAYGHSTPSAHGPMSPGSQAHGYFDIHVPGQWDHEQPDHRVTHGGAQPARGEYAPALPTRPHRSSSGFDMDPRSSGSNIVTVDPSSGRERSHSYTQGRHAAAPPIQRMSSLTVNTGHHSANLSLTTGAPASPLLESYHGTYQSMSPMPSPLLLASHGPTTSGTDMLLEPLSPSGISDGEGGEKKKRRARFHDPVDDAAALANALKGEHRAPDTGPLIEILPGMTHEQILELRSEYKRLVKTGSERRGVNLAKHIRSRLKDEDPVLMKACYATALGRWESEAYWANFWYQGDKTRRELLIESLMGRSNEEVRRIKDSFSDKKYRDSLVACMRTELKEDKFKKAVLLVLEERRMEDHDGHGRPLPVDRRQVEDDVEALYRAVQAERGGESRMLEVVLLRSDAHLREVLQRYERAAGGNFARDALRRSDNLVGEVLAHVLNGVINRPVRDALLLRHALKQATTSSGENGGSGSGKKRDGLRRELLISRLVRLHWDRGHLAAVKRAFREHYGEDLADAVRDGTSGEWGAFCRQLVVTRTPDQVRRFDKVGSVSEVGIGIGNSAGDREREREREEQQREREREQRLRERERELDRERERERDREKERERERERERKREKERDRERERERGRDGRHKSSDGLLGIKDHKHRDRSRSRERSRSHSRRD